MRWRGPLNFLGRLLLACGALNYLNGVDAFTSQNRPHFDLLASAHKNTAGDHNVPESPTIANLKEKYARARDIRTSNGHNAALPHYQDILRIHPTDRTAGTRLAASPLTNNRHDQACGGDRVDELRGSILKARELLMCSNYSHDNVERFFGIQAEQPCTKTKLSCQGPLFVSPVEPGSVFTSNYPLSDAEENPSALACLISLFLLSLAVPKKWMEKAFGETSVTLMQDLGWVFPCSIDPSLMVAYVHIFPLDFTESSSTLWLVTDLHPRVISTTSVGSDGAGNTVMYIGPDSLALPQHFNPYNSLGASGLIPQSDSALDLGTGSGIQALSAIKIASDQNKKIQVVAVDINPRALRFTKFNFILNGLDDHLSLIHADLVSGLCMDKASPNQLERRLEEYKFHVILGNPPFLPVPSDTRSTDNNDTQDSKDEATLESIGRRYGLFSSGGASGELLLRRIIEIASRHLQEEGYLGVVSEFFLQSNDPAFERFGSWWTGGTQPETDRMIPSANGVLFLNEYTIDAETYASRRADNPSEKEIWCRHLKSLNIAAASPGLLYIQKEKNSSSDGNGCLDLAISPVPKTKMGSVWTPSNLDAIAFTRSICNEIWGWEPQ